MWNIELLKYYITLILLRIIIQQVQTTIHEAKDLSLKQSIESHKSENSGNELP